MGIIAVLIPIALFLGLLGLGAFLWSLKTGQFEDLEGEAQRILYNDDDLAPPTSPPPPRPSSAPTAPPGKAEKS